MSDDREKIFGAIRLALEPLPERAAYPEWDDDLVISHPEGEPEGSRERFKAKLEAVHGRLVDSPEALAARLREHDATFGYCDPGLAERFAGLEGITFETEYDLAKVEDYAFGITRASAAIAESGTLVLKDAVTSARLAALAPWIHVAVVEESNLLADIPAAIRTFGDDPSIIFATGPSKTADVEGILIEGVHGPGVQIAMFV